VSSDPLVALLKIATPEESSSAPAVEAALAHPSPAGVAQLLQTPAVGLFRGSLPEGAGVVPGQQIGTLTILGRIHPLLAPDRAQGNVLECCLRPGLHAIEYGQELYKLGASTRRESIEATAAGRREAGLTARQFAVRAPSEGVFYRRPDPQSPPYVQLGDVVETGHPLGLVEVMKCFNQVRFTGLGLPPRARVVAVQVEDTSEITQDQVLFVLEAVE
jgi:acetyl-CoA carboxylase biotin carboxyl carrier protein